MSLLMEHNLKVTSTHDYSPTPVFNFAYTIISTVTKTNFNAAVECLRQ